MTKMTKKIGTMKTMMEVREREIKTLNKIQKVMNHV